MAYAAMKRAEREAEGLGEEVDEEAGRYVTIDLQILRDKFDQFDKDGSGFLEAGEATAALTSIGSKLNIKDLDTDGDNKISFEEFSVFSQLVGKHTHPIFKKAGKNITTDGASKTGTSVFRHNAYLNKAFMQTSSKAWRKLSATKNFDEKALERAFQSIDIDRDGSLDEGEIRLAIKNVAPQITEVEITLMLATADKDDDHKITFDEWKTLMLSDHQQDFEYWEAYGERDMHVALSDRRGQNTRQGSTKPW